jgi:hypothetical protein
MSRKWPDGATRWFKEGEVNDCAQDHEGNRAPAHGGPGGRLGEPNTVRGQTLVAKKTERFASLIATKHAGAERHAHEQRRSRPDNQSSIRKQQTGYKGRSAQQH